MNLRKKKSGFRKRTFSAGLGALLGFTAASQAPRFHESYKETKRDFNTIMGVAFEKGQYTVGKKVRSGTKIKNGKAIVHIGKIAVAKEAARSFKPDKSRRAMKRGGCGAVAGALVGLAFSRKKKRRKR